MDTLRQCSAIGLLALSMMLLTACESGARGPAAISQENGELKIVVCDELSATKVFGEIKDASGFETFWDLTGSAQIEYGSTLTLGQEIPGLSGTASSVDSSSLTSLIVRFVGVESDWSAAFKGLDSREIPADGWLRTDGSVYTEACE